MVAEMKMDNKSNQPVWECFRNMSAVGASLAMEELNGGILVDKIVMYGLIGQVNNSRQIRLDMDFVVG